MSVFKSRLQLMRLCKNVSYESAFHKIWTKDVNTLSVSEQKICLIQKTAEIIITGGRKNNKRGTTTTKDEKMIACSKALSLAVPLPKLLRFFFGEFEGEQKVLNFLKERSSDDETIAQILLQAAEYALLQHLTEEEFFSAIQLAMKYCNSKETLLLPLSFIPEKKKWFLLDKYFFPEFLK